MALKAELEQLRIARARREELEEKVSLQQLRHSLDALSQTEEVLKAQQAAVCCRVCCFHALAWPLDVQCKAIPKHDATDL